MSDVILKRAGKQLSVEEIKATTAAVLEIENFISRIERKGIPFREYLSRRNAAGDLPRF